MEAAEDPEFCKTDENIQCNNHNINMVTPNMYNFTMFTILLGSLVSIKHKSQLRFTQMPLKFQVFVDTPKKPGGRQGHSNSPCLELGYVQ